jgi:hypothetical protein
MSEPNLPYVPVLPCPRRLSLVAHLIAMDGHRVLAFGPIRHPEELELDALIAWHKADHEAEDGVGPRDGHSHHRF